MQLGVGGDWGLGLVDKDVGLWVGLGCSSYVWSGDQVDTVLIMSRDFLAGILRWPCSSCAILAALVLV